MPRGLFQVTLTLTLLCSVASLATAQAPSSPAATPPPAEPPRVTGMVAGALSLETGSTDLFSTTLSAKAAIRHSPKSTFTVDVLYAHVKSKLPDAQTRTTLSDSQTANARFEYDAADGVVFFAKTTGTLDKVRDIRRLEELIGVGVTTGTRQTAFLQVVPVVALMVQDKNIALEKHTQIGAGVTQNLTYQINPTWSASQSLSYRHYFGNDSDYVVEAAASLTGKVTTRLGLQVSFMYNHENLVLPGKLKRYQKLQAGLTYSF